MPTRSVVLVLALLGSLLVPAIASALTRSDVDGAYRKMQTGFFEDARYTPDDIRDADAASRLRIRRTYWEGYASGEVRVRILDEQRIVLTLRDAQGIRRCMIADERIAEGTDFFYARSRSWKAAERRRPAMRRYCPHAR